MRTLLCVGGIARAAATREEEAESAEGAESAIEGRHDCSYKEDGE